MLVILMSCWRLLVVDMVVIMVMGMTVGQIPVGVFVLMLDHGRGGLASQTSAALAHTDLPYALKQAVCDKYGGQGNPFPGNGNTGKNAIYCTCTRLVQQPARKSPAGRTTTNLNKLK